MDGGDPSRPRRRLLLGKWYWITLAVLLALMLAYPLAAGYDPLQERCTALASELPGQVPDWLILNVTDELGAPLSEDFRDDAIRQIAMALERFSFASRVLFDDRTPPDNGTTHTAALRLFIHGGIPTNPLKGADGRMCGNEILVEHVDDDDAMIFRFTHELGHYFGLPHAEGSYMLELSKYRSAATERFLPCQNEILERWSMPGSPYIPHWKESECASSPSRWQPMWRA